MPMDLVFAVVINDGLRFPSGSVAKAGKAVIAYCRVPEAFTEGEFEPGSEERWPPGKALNGETLERLYTALYGNNWRSGNDDGSAYVVLDVEMRAHRIDEAWTPPENTGADEKFSRHYFVAASDGSFHTATPEDVAHGQMR